MTFNQVRIENIKTPEDYIPAVLERVRKEYIQKTFSIMDWSSPEDFLEKLARRSGRLLKVTNQQLNKDLPSLLVLICLTYLLIWGYIPGCAEDGRLFTWLPSPLHTLFVLTDRYVKMDGLRCDQNTVKVAVIFQYKQTYSWTVILLQISLISTYNLDWLNENSSIAFCIRFCFHYQMNDLMTFH